MSKVLSLKEDNFQSNGETVICWKVELDDKTNPVPCYSAEAGKLVVGEPLPAGWEVKVSGKGKDYLFVPKPGGKKGFEAAFRNTKEGQAVEQERMDRRTALMQAVEAWRPENEGESVLDGANLFYAWLRQTSGTGVGTPSPVSDTGGGSRGPSSATSDVTTDGAARTVTSESPGGDESGKVSSPSGDTIKEPCVHEPGPKTTASGKPLCKKCGVIIK